MKSEKFSTTTHILREITFWNINGLWILISVNFSHEKLQNITKMKVISFLKLSKWQFINVSYSQKLISRKMLVTKKIFISAFKTETCELWLILIGNFCKIESLCLIHLAILTYTKKESCQGSTKTYTSTRALTSIIRALIKLHTNSSFELEPFRFLHKTSPNFSDSW